MRAFAILFALVCFLATAPAQTTGFTYQGRLSQGGGAAVGAYDFAYLDIQVRGGSAGTCASGAGFTALTPRQLISPAPRAVFAAAVPAQSLAIRGALRFNPSIGLFEGFNGAYWIAFATTGTPQEPGNVQDFTTAGTFNFVVPAGIFSLGIDLWGSGGGGGGPSSGSVANVCNDPDAPFAGGGGAGGSGAYARVSLDVTPGETIVITVGAGGIGATAAPGATGGPTQVLRGPTLLLRTFGGLGGARGTPHSQVVPFGFDCSVGEISGVGGAGRAAPSFTGAGSFIRGVAGRAGFPGRGPACPQSFFCAASGGVNVDTATTGAINSEAPLPVVSAGTGGNGGSPGSTAATAGEPGRIRLFWN